MCTPVKPRCAQVVCFLCGHEYGTASLAIHHKACRRKRATELDKLAQRLPKRYRNVQVRCVVHSDIRADI